MKCKECDYYQYQVISPKVALHWCLLVDYGARPEMEVKNCQRLKKKSAVVGTANTTENFQAKSDTRVIA